MAVWSAIISVCVLGVAAVTLGTLRRRVIGPFGTLWAAPLLWVAGVKVHVDGAEVLERREARVLIFNHSSTLDTLLMAYLAGPGFVPVVKREFARTPLVGRAFWALGVVYLDRHEPDKARGTVDVLAKTMTEERLTVVVAPEGTRSRTGALGRFKLGAFRIAQTAEVPLLPVFLEGVHAALPWGWRVHPGTVRVRLEPLAPVPEGESLERVADTWHHRFSEWLDDAAA